MEIIHKYFPHLSEMQITQFQQLLAVYKDWNEKINVVSRKDIDELYIRHVLHSLGIAKVLSFLPGSRVLDIGTGGGFPGIPLAILFPDTHFHLVDSIGKKIKVVEGVTSSVGLENVQSSHCRAEVISDQYDFVVSRAVTKMDTFVGWVRGRVAKKSLHELKNGILYLKGGNLEEELSAFPKASIYSLSGYFEEAFFETKSVVHVPIKYRG